MIRRVPEGAPIVNAAQMRAAEEALFATGMSQDTLMERAGAAVAEQVSRLAGGRPVLVLAGPGNNGGDGYVVARLLAARSVPVSVARFGQPKAGAAARMAAQWDGPVCDLIAAQPHPVVVDALLGIGIPRPFDDGIAAKLSAIMAAAALRIAIDLPSGRHADTGDGSGRADVTIALGALKPAHVLGEGGAACGHILLADIAVPVPTDVLTIAAPVLPKWRYDVNKFSRGMIAVVSGAMPGAGWLAGRAALAAGAGYVQLVGTAPAEGAPHALVRRTITRATDLEAVLDDDRIGAVVIGPGLGRDEDAHTLLDIALASPHDLVIDGDALTLLGRSVAERIGADRRRVCLTPHAGEFARMFDSAGDKLTATRAAAQASGATIVHKGPDTVIAYPDGRLIVSTGTNPGLSTAGSGDLLAGIIGARMAAGDGGSDPVAAGVWLHARAANHMDAVFAVDALPDRITQEVNACPTR
ncbi:NAD(P)H-hydrate dehydratase [Sphingomonas floccifaciens]|uniref:Bifunctional NAD(P)H-hydrate repair enzyme n=1 Tax=Sphingomonas floccifaciens TaxID=1844115 RepID=A0ABW4NF60_9SPHN